MHNVRPYFRASVLHGGVNRILGYPVGSVEDRLLTLAHYLSREDQPLAKDDTMSKESSSETSATRWPANGHADLQPLLK